MNNPIQTLRRAYIEILLICYTQENMSIFYLNAIKKGYNSPYLVIILHLSMINRDELGRA